jgi:hypothetical protein
VAERNKKHLRAVKSTDAGKTPEGAPELDIGALADSVVDLDEKLSTHDGIAGLATRVGSIKSAIGAIPDASLDAVRAQIKELIDRLLQINSELQGLLNLKRQLFPRQAGDE